MYYISPTKEKSDDRTVLNLKDSINIWYIADFIL